MARRWTEVVKAPFLSTRQWHAIWEGLGMAMREEDPMPGLPARDWIQEQMETEGSQTDLCICYIAASICDRTNNWSQLIEPELQSDVSLWCKEARNWRVFNWGHLELTGNDFLVLMAKGCLDRPDYLSDPFASVALHDPLGGWKAVDPGTYSGIVQRSKTLEAVIDGILFDGVPQGTPPSADLLAWANFTYKVLGILRQMLSYRS